MTDEKGSKLLGNNWIITLTATLIGVFLALYLNEWMSQKNQRNQKEIATNNVFAEISSNQELLNSSLDRHIELFDFMIFLEKYKGDNDYLVAPQDSMIKFKRQYPKLIVIQDSTLIGDGIYKYEGITNMNFDFFRLNMTNIAWRTMINSGINTTYDFDCLMYLEKIDKLLNEVIKFDELFLENLKKLFEQEIENELFIDHLEWQIGHEKMLTNMYEESEQKLKNCR